MGQRLDQQAGAGEAVAEAIGQRSEIGVGSQELRLSRPWT